MRLTTALAVLALALAGCTAPSQVGGPSVLECLRCPVMLEAGAPVAFEPAIAWDAADDRHLVAAAMETGPDGLAWLVVHPSFDGGATWDAVRIPGGPGAPPDHPLAVATRAADPSVLILDDLTVLVAGFALLATPPPASSGINASGGTTQTFVARSNDGGRSFPEVQLLGPFGQRLGALGDPAFEVASQRTELPRLSRGAGEEVFLAWSRGDGSRAAAQGQAADLGYAYDVLLARSRDNGRTWEDLGAVLEDGGLIGPTVASAGDGRIWVAVHDQREDTVLLARSTDDGATWQETRVVAPAARYLPQLRWLGQEQGLVVAYAALDGEGRETPAVMRSLDDGATWGPPVALDAAGGPGRALVAMDALDDGTLLVSYVHVRADAGREMRAMAVGAGDTLLGPIVLDPDVAPSNPRGEYHGLAARGQEGFVVWSRAAAEGADLAGARVRVGRARPGAGTVVVPPRRNGISPNPLPPRTPRRVPLVGLRRAESPLATGLKPWKRDGSRGGPCGGPCG